MGAIAEPAREGMTRSALRRLAALSPAEAVLLAQLVPLAALLAAALRIAPLPRVVRSVTRLARTPVLNRLPLLHRGADAMRLHDLADMAAALVAGRGRCLPRSILVMGLIQARGGSARLLVGAAPNGGRPAGHAWIESAHWPVVEEPTTTEGLAVFLEL